MVIYKVSGLEQPPCAVLMTGDRAGAFGFEAEEIGEELSDAHKDAGRLNKGAFRQIMPGVWEEDIDTTE